MKALHRVTYYQEPGPTKSDYEPRAYVIMAVTPRISSRLVVPMSARIFQLERTPSVIMWGYHDFDDHTYSSEWGWANAPSFSQGIPKYKSVRNEE
jgi:hypothetical protein